jgi:TrmH family RNA methyltransferase
VTTEIGALGQRLAGLESWMAEAGEGVPYFEVDWRRPAALLIGGEARGHQAALRKLASGQVHIPMPGDLDSLNAAVAAAVILFEIVRQRGKR